MRVRDENKEAAIREKAMEMIVEEGFDGLSMQKLARAAGVSPATIYIYFKNREDLLNRLFIDVQHKFTEVALEGFDPLMHFSEGLWLQWKNRFRFVEKYPVHYTFYEQFRNSPLINHDDVKVPLLKENMKKFIKNAILNGELRKMEPEIFWALAYGPFYAMMRFHLEKKSMMHNTFSLTEARMRVAFEHVLKSFK